MLPTTEILINRLFFFLIVFQTIEIVMQKPYDPTMRRLLELGPTTWLRLLRVSMTERGCVRVIDYNGS
jgi:hypothetical protein